jgi:hypothetical protein
MSLSKEFQPLEIQFHECFRCPLQMVKLLIKFVMSLAPMHHHANVSLDNTQKNHVHDDVQDHFHFDPPAPYVKLLPLPQPQLRARMDARTNPSAQRATQLRSVLACVYAVARQNQITTTVP